MSNSEHETGFAARLLHGAKDLIWESDPMARKPTEADPASKGNEGKPAARPLSGTAPAMNGMSAELLTVVMNRPTAYSALTEAISALSEIPMDEATRYRSAFAVLKKTQQRTVEQIAQAVDVHVDVLETEVTRFTGQSKSAEDGEITARMNEVAVLQAAIEDEKDQVEKLRAETEERIRRLQDDLAKKQERTRELEREAEEKKQAISRTTKNFEEAVDVVKQKLALEKSKIRQYLT